jgi:hypothetical protein
MEEQHVEDIDNVNDDDDDEEENDHEEDNGTVEEESLHLSNSQGNVSERGSRVEQTMRRTSKFITIGDDNKYVFSILLHYLFLAC